MAAPKEKDFGKSEPQAVNVYKYRPPSELEHDGIDHSHGGIPVPHKIVEDDRETFQTDPTHKPVKPIYTGRGK